MTRTLTKANKARLDESWCRVLAGDVQPAVPSFEVDFLDLYFLQVQLVAVFAQIGLKAVRR